MQTDWKERVKTERDELELKIKNLHTFINSDKFQEVEKTQKDLLRLQHQTMIIYYNCLVARLL